MTVLAIDTSAELGGIACFDGATLREASIHSPDGFGPVLFGHIAALVPDLAAIDCFAAASGPGSFTGVRIALTAAKGLAEACGKPAVAVSNLRALAWFGQAPLRATLLDARRGEIYGAVYDEQLNAVVPERVLAFPQWLAQLPEGDIEFIGTNLAPFAPALAGKRLVHPEGTLAGAVARIAFLEHAAGRCVDPAALDANYVRRSDAELHWKDPGTQHAR